MDAWKIAAKISAEPELGPEFFGIKPRSITTPEAILNEVSRSTGRPVKDISYAVREITVPGDEDPQTVKDLLNLLEAYDEGPF